MKRRLLWGLLLFSVLVLAGVAFVALQTPPTVRHMYAQWTATELIKVAHFKTQHLPQTWDDLRPWNGKTRFTYPAGIDWEQLRSRTEIDFAQIAEIQRLALADQPFPARPHVVKHHGTFKWRWINPNEELYQYFKNGVVEFYDPDSESP